MVALIVIFIVIALVSSTMRRGGLAGWLALFAAFMVAFGSGQPTGDDWTAAVFVAIVVFVGVRVAQSHLRERPPSRVRQRLAGRPADRTPDAHPPTGRTTVPTPQEITTLDEEIHRLDDGSGQFAHEPGIAPPAWARRSDCDALKPGD